MHIAVVMLWVRDTEHGVECAHEADVMQFRLFPGTYTNQDLLIRCFLSVMSCGAILRGPIESTKAL